MHGQKKSVEEEEKTLHFAIKISIPTKKSTDKKPVTFRKSIPPFGLFSYYRIIKGTAIITHSINSCIEKSWKKQQHLATIITLNQ